MNSINLIGRLTYEPELKSTPSGVSVCHFQMAVDRKYTPKGEERQADFIDCVAWRQTAEFVARNFHKGKDIAVDGTLQTRNFTDKDGNQRKAYEVQVDDVFFCGGKPPEERGKDIVVNDDDLPF